MVQALNIFAVSVPGCLFCIVSCIGSNLPPYRLFIYLHEQTTAKHIKRLKTAHSAYNGMTCYSRLFRATKKPGYYLPGCNLLYFVVLWLFPHYTGFLLRPVVYYSRCGFRAVHWHMIKLYLLRCHVIALTIGGESFATFNP